VAAPIRKVTPSGFGTLPPTPAIGEILKPLNAAASPSIHASLGTLGVVLSSTVPGSLQRSSVARQQMRRQRRLG
jgi:hypothetical protein